MAQVEAGPLDHAFRPMAGGDTSLLVEEMGS
jgi:hypothetical protein